MCPTSKCISIPGLPSLAECRVRAVSVLQDSHTPLYTTDRAGHRNDLVLFTTAGTAAGRSRPTAYSASLPRERAPTRTNWYVPLLEDLITVLLPNL